MSEPIDDYDEGSVVAAGSPGVRAKRHVDGYLALDPE
jgi:hypothetical protein